VKGGGPRYEKAPPPAADDLLLDARKERIEEVIAHRTRNVVIVLDRLEDSFNMAAVLRTCEGMGLQEVHIVENPECDFVPHSSVTQGCDKWLDLHFYKTFEECRAALKKRGYAIWASALGANGQSLYSLKFDQKMAMVVGNERYGVSADVLEGCDGIFWIPMRGFSQSLNVSVATAMTIGRAVSWRAEHLGVTGDLPQPEIEELRSRFQMLSVKQRRRLYGKEAL
jgi:tRNA (guanosine-2'-O-)-methyltransferase